MPSYKRKLDTANNNYNIVSKKSKGAKTSAIKGYVSNTELYAKTLVNPMSETRAKIPDLSCCKTSTFSISETFDWDPTWKFSTETDIYPNLLGIKFGCGKFYKKKFAFFLFKL
nr:hypothetical protein [Cressdnaviricota sp.]